MSSLLQSCASTQVYLYHSFMYSPRTVILTAFIVSEKTGHTHFKHSCLLVLTNTSDLPLAGQRISGLQTLYFTLVAQSILMASPKVMQCIHNSIHQFLLNRSRTSAQDLWPIIEL